MTPVHKEPTSNFDVTSWLDEEFLTVMHSTALQRM